MSTRKRMMRVSTREEKGLANGLDANEKGVNNQMVETSK
jgi:hypothetical protein